MKLRSGGQQAHEWVVDYSAARARAIQWLGDRYLLARPINVSDSALRQTMRTRLGTARRVLDTGE